MWHIFVVGRLGWIEQHIFLWGWKWGSLTVYLQGRKCPWETWRWRKLLLREHQSDPGQLAWRLWQSAAARIWRWEAISLVDQTSVLSTAPHPSTYYYANVQKENSMRRCRGTGERPRVCSNPVSAPPLLVILHVSYLNSLSLSFLNCSVSVLLTSQSCVYWMRFSM